MRVTIARVESPREGGHLRGTFNHEAFYEALDATRQARKLTWKQVAAEAGLSPSTLTRLGQGKRPDVDSLGALCNWAGLDADEFMKSSGIKAGPEPLAVIGTYLRGDKNLTDESAKMLEQLVRTTYETLRRDK